MSDEKDGKPKTPKSPTRSGSEDLDALARKLEAKRAGPPKQAQDGPSGMALGLKYATEFSAATLVGAALGYGFDRFVGTAPWGLLAGLFLGLAAGIREIIRSARQDMDSHGADNADHE